MDDDGSRGFLNSLGPINGAIASIGGLFGLFVALWWMATWFANVSQLSATQTKMLATLEAIQNTQVTDSVTIATLQQEVADNQAEIHQELVDDQQDRSEHSP